MESSVNFCSASHDGHALLQDADGEAADDIDQRDENARDRVAAHKLAGAVHRAVEIGFLAWTLRPARGGGLVDDAGVHFRIDGHLLSRHGVEGETRRDLGNAARALCDDHEIDDDENQEHDRADDIIAADDEMPERVDDVARVAVDENQARGGDIEREPVKRDCKEQRGETRKFRRVLDIDDDEQQEEGDGDARREQQIEDDGGNREAPAGRPSRTARKQKAGRPFSGRR